jgi:rod shape-determining protein MreC
MRLSENKQFGNEIFNFNPFHWLVVLLIGVVIFLLNYFNIIDPLTSFFEYSSIGLRTSVYTNSQKMNAFFSNLQRFPQLSSENEDLKAKNIELESEVAQAEVIFNENKALIQESGINYNRNYKRTGVKIIGRDVARPDFLRINKGERDDIQVGDAVVKEKIVVGKVVATGEYDSTVQLIISSELSFPVKSASQNIGIAKGNGDNRVKIEKILKEIPLKEGGRIFTSGINDDFPPDLYIGEVEKVEDDPRLTTKSAVLKSPLNFSNLFQVVVLTKQP